MNSPSATRPQLEPPRPGDLFRFPVTKETPVSWAVLLPHRDDPGLLFTVPVDEFPVASLTDVLAPVTEQHGALTLRCGYGLWVPEDEFAVSHHVGRLDAEVVRQAKRRLRALVIGTESGLEIEHADLAPEYDNWITEVEKAYAALTAWLNREAS